MYNSQQPLVSIVITNYNYARYLREAVDSAVNQTYTNTEVIVVDDGSTDDSRRLIESYTDKIIPVYKQNGGQASAFNKGFAVSKGEILCLLDADDVFLPQKVEESVQAFKNNPNAVVVYHKTQNIDQNGKVSSKPWPPFKSIKGNILNQVVKTGSWWPFPPTTALSFSRNFLCKVMDVPEGKEKQGLWVDCYLADLAPFLGEVVGIDQVLSYYRIHGSNHWSNQTSIFEQQRQQDLLKHQEFRVQELNTNLQRLKITKQVSLANHLPYQLHKYKLGSNINLLYISKLILQNPWENRQSSKLKSLFLLWLQKRHYSRIC
jgi:glycosyltransferase involved in cell wall biosynthesis